MPYNFQNVTAGSQNLAMATSGTNAGSYEIIPFSNSYRANDSRPPALPPLRHWWRRLVKRRQQLCRTGGAGRRGNVLRTGDQSGAGSAGNAANLLSDLKEHHDHPQRWQRGRMQHERQHRCGRLQLQKPDCCRLRHSERDRNQHFLSPTRPNWANAGRRCRLRSPPRRRERSFTRLLWARRLLEGARPMRNTRLPDRITAQYRGRAGPIAANLVTR